MTNINDNDEVFIIQFKDTDYYEFEYLDKYIWSNLDQNKRLILSQNIPYKNTNYGIQGFNLIFFEVFDRTKNLIYTLDYNNRSLIHNNEIIFIENIEYSYKPEIINLDTFSHYNDISDNDIIIILEKYNEFEFEYLDKYVWSNLDQNKRLILSQKIPYKNNYRGFLNINNLYFQLFNNLTKIITFIDYETINPIIFKQNIQYSYKPKIINLNLDNFNINNDDLIIAIQEDNDIIECLDIYIHSKSISNILICSEKIPITNYDYGIDKNKNIYLLYWCNINNIVEFLQEIPLNQFEITLTNNIEYSYNPKILNIIIDNINNNDILAIIQNSECLDIYKYNELDINKKFLCSRNIPLNYFDTNSYNGFINENNSFIYLLYDNVKKTIEPLYTNCNIFIENDIKLYRYEGSYNPIIFNLNNYSLSNIFNNDIIAILEKKDNLECVGKYIWNNDDNIKQIICSQKSDFFSEDNYGITNVDNLIFELYRSNIKVIERLDILFELDNLNNEEGKIYNVVNFEYIQKNFNIYNLGFLETIQTNLIYNFQSNIFIYKSNNNNNIDNYNITWYYNNIQYESDKNDNEILDLSPLIISQFNIQTLI